MNDLGTEYLGLYHTDVLAATSVTFDSTKSDRIYYLIICWLGIGYSNESPAASSPRAN